MGGGPSSWLVDGAGLPLRGGNTRQSQSRRLSKSRDDQLSGTPPRVAAILLAGLFNVGFLVYSVLGSSSSR